MQIDFKHRMAAHCENGTTMNLLNHQGIHLSEPLIFGIGSGCFFSYMPFYKVNGLPVISFRHWPGIIFKRSTDKLGVAIERMKFKRQQHAMAALDALLDRGVPVGLLVGVFNLTYFPPEYRFHFNAHNMVVIGKEDDHYFVSDPVMENIETLSSRDLQRVRFAKGTYPPKGRMYWVTHKPGAIDLETAIRRGIRKNCEDMLRIPVPLFGVKGIHYIANRVKEWDKKYGPAKAALLLGQFIRMLEEIGTGGAGFRFMYAAFLQETAGIFNDTAFRQLSEEMTKIGDSWREFASLGAKNLRNRGVEETPYPVLAEHLHRIADRERILFQELDGLVRK